MTKTNEATAAEILKTALKAAGVKKGDRIYTILRSVSRTGMSREVSFLTFHKGEPYYLNSAIASAFPFYKRSNGEFSAIVVKGCGIDAGFEVVSAISKAVHDDHYAIKHEWL
jgi:hypothetical protein